MENLEPLTVSPLEKIMLLFTVPQDGSGKATGLTEFYLDSLTRHSMQ